MFTKTKEVEYTDRWGDKQTRKVTTLTTFSIVSITLASLFMFFMLFMFRTVGAGQVGIVTRFGEVNRVETSGVAIKLPWPIERLERMETRVQKDEQQVSAATSDLQDANASIALNYALDNDTALRVYKELGKDYKDRVVTPAVQESFKQASARYTASELITKREEVKKIAYEVIKERLDKYGIRVVDLNVVNFGFSKEFNQAIEAVQVANQNVARARQELETTKVEAQKQIEAAQGAAEAQRLQQTTLTPQLLEKLRIEMQMEAIKKWNGVMPTTNAGDGSILSIPLR